MGTVFNECEFRLASRKLDNALKADYEGSSNEVMQTDQLGLVNTSASGESSKQDEGVLIFLRSNMKIKVDPWVVY